MVTESRVNVALTAEHMIRNGTWKFEDGVFYQAFGDEVYSFSSDGFVPDRDDVRRLLSFVLGLDIDLDSFYSEISDSRFSFLADTFDGLVPPAAPTPYQALVEVIAQQQVNFDLAQRTIRALVRLAGRKVGDVHSFPDPETIADMGQEGLAKVKLGYRSRYIHSLTLEYLKGNLKLELDGLSEEDAVSYLTKFRGIGRWTAELFLTYGLRMNTYPAGDLGLRRGIAKVLGRRVKEVREQDVRDIIDPYGKWKGLLAYYIVCYDRKTQLERRRGSGSNER